MFPFVFNKSGCEIYLTTQRKKIKQSTLSISSTPVLVAGDPRNQAPELNPASQQNRLSKENHFNLSIYYCRTLATKEKLNYVFVVSLYDIAIKENTGGGGRENVEIYRSVVLSK